MPNWRSTPQLAWNSRSSKRRPLHRNLKTALFPARFFVGEAVLEMAAKDRHGATAKKRERALCSANVVLRIALATAEG
ncbi:hypothetical protein GFL51_27145 [Rhizobium leguminosarum bv. viciae]|nr:hypothetical protein [Rhizobium leguminosarum bv. viciae]